MATLFVGKKFVLAVDAARTFFDGDIPEILFVVRKFLQVLASGGFKIHTVVIVSERLQWSNPRQTWVKNWRYQFSILEYVLYKRPGSHMSIQVLVNNEKRWEALLTTSRYGFKKSCTLLCRERQLSNLWWLLLLNTQLWFGYTQDGSQCHSHSLQRSSSWMNENSRNCTYTLPNLSILKIMIHRNQTSTLVEYFSQKRGSNYLCRCCSSNLLIDTSWPIIWIQRRSDREMVRNLGLVRESDPAKLRLVWNWRYCKYNTMYDLE